MKYYATLCFHKWYDVTFSYLLIFGCMIVFRRGLAEAFLPIQQPSHVSHEILRRKESLVSNGKETLRWCNNFPRHIHFGSRNINVEYVDHKVQRESETSRKNYSTNNNLSKKISRNSAQTNYPEPTIVEVTGSISNKTNEFAIKGNHHSLSTIHNGLNTASVSNRKGSKNSAASEVRISLNNATTPKTKKGSLKNRNHWNANYSTSLKSQTLIKNAATRYVTSSSAERAVCVLQTFLNIPPENCNPANLVCALTLSAKEMNRETNPKLRSLVYRTTEILKLLIDRRKLSLRQLCNVIWAIAKHYEQDPLLLPRINDSTSPRINDSTSLSKDGVIGKAETWDLSYDLIDSPITRIEAIIDEIAIQIVQILQKRKIITTTTKKSNKEDFKLKELCMATWAYGVLRRRQRPAGWKHEARIGRVPNVNNNNDQSSSQHMYNTIKFEQWDVSSVADTSKNEDQSEEEWMDSSPVGNLFDEVAETLCEPLNQTIGSEEYDFYVDLRVQACQWSELANLAWAFASYGWSQTRQSMTLLNHITEEASRRLKRDTYESKDVLSRDIAQIAWSVGTLQADNYRLADKFVEFVDSVSNAYEWKKSKNGLNRPFKDWSCADIVQIVSSLAHARIDDQPLLRSLYSEALQILQSPKSTSSFTRRSFLPWEVSILLWAQARLYLKSSNDTIFAEFAEQAVNTIHGMITATNSFEQAELFAQEQANIAWSITVLELYTTNGMDLLVKLLTEASTNCEKEGMIQLEHAHQLWQALSLLQSDYPHYTHSIPRWFLTYLEDRWVLEKARLKLSSARHKSLSETLDLMGIPHFNEHDEDIDVAIVLKPKATWTHETSILGAMHNDIGGVKMAVEFDGPNHFARQKYSDIRNKLKPSHRALGHTVLKYRQLKRQGWTVVRIPYYEWDKIPFWASMERQRYIQRKLKTHEVIRFSGPDVSQYKPQIPSRKSRFD